jgi:hypothetical protein
VSAVVGVEKLIKAKAELARSFRPRQRRVSENAFKSRGQKREWRAPERKWAKGELSGGEVAELPLHPVTGALRGDRWALVRSVLYGAGRCCGVLAWHGPDFC